MSWNLYSLCSAWCSANDDKIKDKIVFALGRKRHKNDILARVINYRRMVNCVFKSDTFSLNNYIIFVFVTRWDGLVVRVSVSHTVKGRGFAPWLGDTKDHHEHGTHCLPAWHAGIGVGVCQCINLTV